MKIRYSLNMNVHPKKYFLLVLLAVIVFANHAYASSSWQTVGGAGFSPGSISSASIAFTSSGTPYVAFDDNSNSNKATVMQYNGTNWVDVGTPGFTTSVANNLAFAISPTTNVPYIVYSDGNNAGAAIVMEFDGMNWVNVGTPDFTTTGAYYPKIAISPSGTPYIAYADAANSNEVSVMEFDGTNWDQVGAADFGGTGSDYPALTFSPSGTPYVAFVDSAHSNETTVMEYNGRSWVGVGSPDFNTPNSGQPSIAVDASGNVYVAYKDLFDSGEAAVMEYATAGSGWSPVSPNPSSPGFSAGNTVYISIALDSSGVPYVAYRDIANSNKMTVMSYDGANWNNVGSAGFSAGTVGGPLVAINPATNVPYVVYEDAANSNYATVEAYLPTPSTTPPIFTDPVAGTYVDTGTIPIAYTLPSTPQGGSINLTFTPASGTPIDFTLNAASPETAPVSFNLPISSGYTGMPEIASVSNNATSIPDGTYTVDLAYKDTNDDSPVDVSVSGIVVAPPAATDISSVGVTGFIAPAPRAVPELASGLSPADGAQYSVKSLTWTPADATFNATSAYSATIVLTSNAGFEFPSSIPTPPTVSFLGNTNGSSLISAETVTGTGSGNTFQFAVSFSPSVSVPTIENTSATDITQTSATLGASIIYDGGEPIAAKGMLYIPDAHISDLQQRPSILTNALATQIDTASGQTTVQGPINFTENVSGLTCGTKYDYLSFASNSPGDQGILSAHNGGGGMWGVSVNPSKALSFAIFTTLPCSESSQPSEFIYGGGTAYVCTDPKATNYDTYSSSSNTACQYSNASSAVSSIGTLPSSSALSPNVIVRSLKYGMKGSDVILLQQYLNGHQYVIAVTGPGSPGHETTSFGLLTKKAVQKFQRDHHLTPDGVVGAKTRALMNN